MGLLTTVRQAYILASPYFSPSKENGGRIVGLAGSIFMMAFRARYDEVMRSHIYAVFDFFEQKKPITEFNGVFRSGVGGFVAIMATDMFSTYLIERVALSFRNAMLGSTLERWLKEGNYLGVKTLDSETSGKIRCTLQDQVPNFTATTLSWIDRIGDLVVNLLSLYRIYHLSKPLYSKSLQFPFNHPGGVFATMIGVLGLFTLIKVRAQESIEKSHAALDQKETEVLNQIIFLERNALQVASLPLGYSKNILTNIKNKSASMLSEASSFALSRFFNSNFTFMFPQASQLSFLYLASLFAKANPEHFDYTNSFLPLFRECSTFMWRNTQFIQNVLNAWVHYRKSIQRIDTLSDVISRYEVQKESSTITRGDHLSIQGLSVTVGKDAKPLFSELNLKLEPGFVYFVKGENGSGKTVLLKTLAGFHPFKIGQITVPGPVRYLQPKIEIDPTKVDFAKMVSQIFGIEKPEEVEKVRGHLKEFRSFHSNAQWKIPEITTGKRDWSKLSDGEKQVLNLAVVFTMMENVETPSLILVDETLGPVDNHSKVGTPPRQKALELLKKLADGKTKHTILIVDHSGAGMEWTGKNKIKTSKDADFEIYKLD